MSKQERVDEIFGRLASLLGKGASGVAKGASGVAKGLSKAGDKFDKFSAEDARKKKLKQDDKDAATDFKNVRKRGKKLGKGMSDEDAIKLRQTRRALARERLAKKGIKLGGGSDFQSKGDFGAKAPGQFDSETMSIGPKKTVRSPRDIFLQQMRRRMAKRRLTMSSELPDLPDVSEDRPYEKGEGPLGLTSKLPKKPGERKPEQRPTKQLKHGTSNTGNTLTQVDLLKKRLADLQGVDTADKEREAAANTAIDAADKLSDKQQKTLAKNTRRKSTVNVTARKGHEVPSDTTLKDLPKDAQGTVKIGDKEINTKFGSDDEEDKVNPEKVERGKKVVRKRSADVLRNKRNPEGAAPSTLVQVRKATKARHEKPDASEDPSKSKGGLGTQVAKPDPEVKALPKIDPKDVEDKNFAALDTGNPARVNSDPNDSRLKAGDEYQRGVDKPEGSPERGGDEGSQEQKDRARREKAEKERKKLSNEVRRRRKGTRLPSADGDTIEDLEDLHKQATINQMRGDKSKFAKTNKKFISDVEKWDNENANKLKRKKLNRRLSKAFNKQRKNVPIIKMLDALRTKRGQVVPKTTKRSNNNTSNDGPLY